MTFNSFICITKLQLSLPANIFDKFNYFEEGSNFFEIKTQWQFFIHFFFLSFPKWSIQIANRTVHKIICKLFNKRNDALGNCEMKKINHYPSFFFFSFICAADTFFLFHLNTISSFTNCQITSSLKIILLHN